MSASENDSDGSQTPVPSEGASERRKPGTSHASDASLNLPGGSNPFLPADAFPETTSPSPRAVGTIENPDLQRRRRLALVLGLILMTYSLAAIELNANATIAPLGIPLKVANPDLLGIGLALATLYATLRYTYYDLVCSLSPRRFRAVLMEEETESDETDYRYELFEGESRSEVLTQLNLHFPSLSSVGVLVTEPEHEMERHIVEYKLPPYTRWLAFVQDVDYTSPVWFPFIAIGLWIWKFIL